jgi:hypothetical protein
MEAGGSMQITRKMLDEATQEGVLQHGQAEALWAFFARGQGDRATFKAAHIMYYLGGMTAIGAMTLFMTLGWERFGGTGLLLIAAGFAAIALLLTEALLRRDLPLPAGITAVLAVVMVPLAVYGLQHALGLWSGDGPGRGYRDFHLLVDWRWVLMELATLAAGAIALWRYRLPFLVMPVAVTLWYMSMDLVPFLFGGSPGAFFSPEARQVCTAYGLCMIVLAVWMDARTRSRKDFAFWVYLAGVLTFWGGLTSMDSHGEWGRFAYLCINVLLLALGSALARRVFAVFGGIGVAVYLGHLASAVFKDSLLFPVALTAIGLGIVGAGIWWQRHEDALGAKLRALLPAALRELAENRAQP